MFMISMQSNYLDLNVCICLLLFLDSRCHQFLITLTHVNDAVDIVMY